MHIHLDALGGVAGDMIVAALLDAWPELAGAVEANLALVQDGSVRAAVLPHDDGVLTGRRFAVSKSGEDEVRQKSHAHQHEPHGHHHHVGDESQDHVHLHGHHHHTHWSELRAMLEQSSLPRPVKATATGIFTELAMAEAEVHGKEIDAVAFHEVGNWDSIADIVAAATLITGCGATSWSVGSLPLGRGWVETDHGRLPVPAPATVLLLKGFRFHDDGRAGERVTPTGAAILRYLMPAASIGARPLRLSRSGIGFGTRRLQGMSNVLRVLAFDNDFGQDSVGVIQFEIDDQSGEELAAALEAIRAEPGVLDVTQGTLIGKKGRTMFAIQVLCQPQSLDKVRDVCFRQTTTLGLRFRIEMRAILPRHSITTPDNIRVKVAERPGGMTAKAEMDDFMVAPSQRQRADLRRQAEAMALEKTPE